MSSESGVLLGSQEPTLHVVPSRSGSLGEEAVELAASVGLHLDPWQRLVVESTLSVRDDGKWAARDVGVIVPRQNGKGSILECLELAGLFLLDERLILHSAHEFKTSQEAFLRVRQLIEGSRELEKRVRRIRTANGEEAVELVSGARLRFMARSAGSGRGFSADRVILDEAYRLSPQMMQALYFTLSARQNPQVIYASSSPPEIDEWSEQIRNMKARAESDDPGRLVWAEWSNPADVDPEDREAWARANPGLNVERDNGSQLTEDDLEGELQTFRHNLDSFLVERLGVWRSTSLSSKIPQRVWEAAKVDVSPDSTSACFALDISPDRSSAAIAVCDEQTVELADYRNGTDWVVSRCIELHDKWSPRGFVVDGAGPAAGLVPDLESAGLKVVVTSARDYAGACGRIYDALTNEQLSHTGQAALSAAVLGAATRVLGDAWAWSRSKSQVDIAPLVAATLALWGAATLEVEEAPDPVLAVW